MPIHDWAKVDAGIFHNFHLEWISVIRNALNHGLLPKDYYALAEQWASRLGPDVLTLHTPVEGPAGEDTSDHGDHPVGGIATATAPPKARFHLRMDESRFYVLKSRRVVVRHVSGDRIVAVVEIVSPGNKSSEQAIRDFVQKAWDLMASGVHLLVIDLFPPTTRDPNGIHDLIWGAGDTKVVRSAEELFTCASYMSIYFREAFVETPGVGEALPNMPLFLSADCYVSVPLEQTYEKAMQGVPDRWLRVLTSSP